MSALSYRLGVLRFIYNTVSLLGHTALHLQHYFSSKTVLVDPEIIDLPSSLELVIDLAKDEIALVRSRAGLPSCNAHPPGHSE